MASKKPALTLYRGLPTPSNYIWSPFVTKLEARLRFAGVPYVTAAGSLSKAPKGKVPYVEVRKPGQGEEAEGEAVVLSDSSLIAERLVEDGVLGDLNARLGARERVEDWGVRALLEERLYFLQVRGSCRRAGGQTADSGWRSWWLGGSVVADGWLTDCDRVTRNGTIITTRCGRIFCRRCLGPCRWSSGSLYIAST